jgi:hypothetical protein
VAREPGTAGSASCVSAPSWRGHLSMALPRPPANLACVLAMGAVAASRLVQGPLGFGHLPQGEIALTDFLAQLLAMLRVDDNGGGPGICMPCNKCGKVRLQRVWLDVVGDDTVALKGFCTRCGRRVEARLEV